MLLDCAKLTHWRCEAQFGEMFAMQRDYELWISLELEPRENIGLFEEQWNHFDRLEPGTRLIHNTKRRTQPWKTGLPVDFTIRDRRVGGLLPTRWLYTVDALLHGETASGLYRRHPDPRQEAFFFGLVRECLDQGLLTEDYLREEIRRNHIRHDSLELAERRSEEHTSELQSLMRISYAVFCLKKKLIINTIRAHREPQQKITTIHTR